MNRTLWLAALLFGCGGCNSEETPTPTPDAGATPAVVVLTNARIYTANDARAFVAALAIEDGRIIAAGTEADAIDAAPGAEVWDLGGRLVVPGFHDLHLHALEAGINGDLCGLSPDADLATYEQELADCAADQADSDWVRVAGMSGQVVFEQEPPIDVLDRAVPDRPLMVLDDLGHAAFANRLGLTASGIDDDSPDPPGGGYTRDAQGNLTGGLLENAQQRLRDAATPNADALHAGLLTALAVLAANGVTTISDAGGYWTRGHPEAWARVEADGQLTVRAHNALYLYPDHDADEQIAALEARFSDDPGRRLRWNTVKIYLDGILSLGTATLVAPYDVPPAPEFPRGFPYFTDAALTTYVDALSAAGFRLHFHTVGDAAVRGALDALEGLPARGHRLTHNYLVHPDDVPRFAELDAVADFQIGEGVGSEEAADGFGEFVGARADRLLPVRDLLDAGGRVTLSSDWDADALSPFGIISRTVGRSFQAVPDVTTAVHLLTIEPARALGHDDQVGSLEVGKLADLVVVDRDIFEATLAEVAEATPVLTMLEGEVIYRAPGVTIGPR